MRKAEFLDHWNAIKENQKIKIQPVQYKHQGSTYDEEESALPAAENSLIRCCQS